MRAIKYPLESENELPQASRQTCIRVGRHFRDLVFTIAHDMKTRWDKAQCINFKGVNAPLFFQLFLIE